MVKEKPQSLRDDYMDLIRRFPLGAIHGKKELRQANKVLASLMILPEQDLSEGQEKYLDALFILVHEAEKAIRDELLAELAPLDVLKHLMEESDLNVKKLGEIIGSQPNASLIFNGKRQLSKGNIHKLAEHFHVSPAVFI